MSYSWKWICHDCDTRKVSDVLAIDDWDGEVAIGPECPECGAQMKVETESGCPCGHTVLDTSGEPCIFCGGYIGQARATGGQP